MSDPVHQSDAPTCAPTDTFAAWQPGKPIAGWAIVEGEGAPVRFVTAKCKLDQPNTVVVSFNRGVNGRVEGIVTHLDFRMGETFFLDQREAITRALRAANRTYTTLITRVSDAEARSRQIVESFSRGEDFTLSTESFMRALYAAHDAVTEAERQRDIAAYRFEWLQAMYFALPGTSHDTYMADLYRVD